MKHLPNQTYSLAQLEIHSEQYGYTAELQSCRHWRKEIMRTKQNTDARALFLLSECTRAVRIASRSVENRYSVPKVSASEQADFTSELVSRLLAENNGSVPENDSLARSYLVKRAQGCILNDKSRHGLDISQPSEAEAQSDARLDGELSIPIEAELAAAGLWEHTSRTGRRAMMAAMTGGTRQEWADFYGYTVESWKTMAKRGRVELRTIGEDAIRQAVRDADAATFDDDDRAARAERELIETMEAS
jgi:hypothetical protein